MSNKLVLVLSLVVLIGAGDALGELVGYWKLDEGGGTKALDSSGKGNDGTIMNKPKWIQGVNGTALEFHGLGAAGGGGDYISVPHKPSLDITGATSMALWIKPQADDPEGKATTTAPMAKADSAAAVSWSFQVRYGWGGAPKTFMAFTFNTSPRAWAFVDGKLTRDEWCHIACSYDGKTLKAFRNGNQTDSTAMGAITSSPTPVLIGTDGWGCDWIGCIDDVRMYNHALSAAEIQAAMAIEPILTAYGPTPRDGETISATQTTLKWQPGEKATAHELYFGESFDQVNAATNADKPPFIAKLTKTQQLIGTAAAPVKALTPGKTYYWRVDEITADKTLKGTVWSFMVRPLIATKPFPVDGMKYVDPNQDLSWETGLNSIFHTVYTGQSFDEVNDASEGILCPNPTFDPGTLALDTTYYWRVDEFAVPPGISHKGAIWSFTTRGTGGGAKARYFSGMGLAGKPVLTRIEGTINVNTSAEVAAGLSDNLSARWTANVEAPFTEAYTLATTSDDGVRLWFDGRLVISNWTDHGSTTNTATVNLIAGQVYSIRMEWYENTGGAVAQLSWESPTLARQIIPQGWLQLPVRAAGPYPANGAANTPQTMTLRWIGGDQAASHQIYFGDDKDTVAAATTPTDTQPAAQATYNPGALQWGKTYYWRVDEVNAASADSPWKGCLWSFTTANFLVVDDFETYTDEIGERIFQTWLDGFGYTDPVEVPGNGTNATVGYMQAPFAEQQIVHSGFQAMPMDYNNVGAPFYSEAERTWSSPQNWTVNGMNTLVLFVRGAGSNGADPLYVAVQDNSNRVAVVTHSDAAAVKSIQWLEWKIPLSQFSSVNAATVKKMYIGVGNRNSPKAGGAGSLYIDDIRVIKAQ